MDGQYHGGHVGDLSQQLLDQLQVLLRFCLPSFLNYFILTDPSVPAVPGLARHGYTQE